MPTNHDSSLPGTEELGIAWNREQAWSRLEQQLPREKTRRMRVVIWPALAASILAAGLFIARAINHGTPLSLARQQERLPFTFRATGTAYRTPAAVPAMQPVAYAKNVSVQQKRKHTTVPDKKEQSLIVFARTSQPDSGMNYTTSALLDIGRQPLCYSISRPENTLQ